MNLYHRILLLSFLQSFSTILLERGIYFYTAQRFAFSPEQNLALAVAIGAIMAVSALVSHPLARRFGERRVLILSILLLGAIHSGLLLWPGNAGAVFALGAMGGGLSGVRWPIIESWVGAGKDPRRAASAVGAFCFSWAIAVPISIACAGQLIDAGGGWLFAAAALTNLITLVLATTFPPRPEHLQDTDPSRPSAARLAELSRLLTACRIVMWCSYAAMFILAPTAPMILAEKGLDVRWASAAAGVIDACRLTAFLCLHRWRGWHGKRTMLAVVMLGLPAGFLLVMGSSTLAGVVAGEVIFGLAAGSVYFASLYYALLVRNAAVDAGGIHESLIGLGLASGPLLGVGGAYFAQEWNSRTLGYGAVIGPLFFLAFPIALNRLRSITAPSAGAKCPGK